MLTEREEMIVRWLRTEPAEFIAYVHEPSGAWALADAIERGEHLKRPEPSIPASEWDKTPSVGH